ncbi:MAG: sulfate adenylyltransferase [Frankiaceae bacterium]|nr:sulfate adenylyltransferase [Frankiaceae bacterium]
MPYQEAAEPGLLVRRPDLRSRLGGDHVTETPERTSSPALPAPHGGRLVDLTIDAGAPDADRLRHPTLLLTPQQLCDLELLAIGGFSPLTGFLGAADYASVCADMRLTNGLLWPIPVVLEVPAECARGLRLGSRLNLVGPDGQLLAVQHVEEKWWRDRRAEAGAVFGTTDLVHAGVKRLLNGPDGVCLAGHLEMVRHPRHSDFPLLRRTPAELRREFATRGWRKVVAFQTRNPMHRAHLELTLRAAEQAGAHILLHPVVGLTKPGDVDYRIRVRCYRALLPSYPPDTALLSLLPLAMRMAGPREALWHAIIRKNFGASHLIVGRDHAGPGNDRSGRPFYAPYASQELVRRHEQELGIRMLSFPKLVYVEELDRYMPEDQVPAGARAFAISGTEQRRRLADGEPLPPWFTPPSVAEELQAAFRIPHQRSR